MNLVWLRNDLRISDQRALGAAAAEGGSVLAVFCLCQRQWQRHHMAAVRRDFLLRNLECLRLQLQAVGIPLFVLDCHDFAAVPEALLKLARTTGARRLFFNEEYAIDEWRRDMAVERCFRENGMEVRRCCDHVVVPAGQLRSGRGECYRVFTPFQKAWLKLVVENPALLAPAPIMNTQPHLFPGDGAALPTDTPHPLAHLWPAGEAEAQRRLQAFLDGPIRRYHLDRDFPAIEGTSALSPYLACGVLSIRQCVSAALELANGGSEGARVWLSELIWREFFQHILRAFPRVSTNRAFQEHTETVAWRYDEGEFAAWCEGRTGYPIVDAAMAQLHSTGWMHNRLRMICAMFLTKDLLIDWRWGERYFMEHLVDGDLAANNGGWQWAASTGTDAVPYFRVFHPTTQSKRFDPHGKFIRHFLPQLAELDEKYIHEPHDSSGLLRPNIDYPRPMVDHKVARQRAIDAFSRNLKPR
ncbi:deoxyribodipyrimidine photo-lyase [Desulfurispirillum indicum]|uniref:deoxyribodipyrimidine photo-lyase n=1 Tax=Desulfurispirillum indicum TaxID=936456 RepID=UPI001CFBC5F4|nr:deoxyribodipyrimidine photo-lyase [Desulfurispirillum indicum]UCZ56560.1 deoxyribodipyrimidine photo-lyase [Desulfurispirillum indicum]